MVLSTSVARGEARPVYDHALARSPTFREEVETTDARAARAGHDAHIGKGRHGSDDCQGNGEDETPHGDLRSPLASFVTRKTAEMQQAHPGFNERHWHHVQTDCLRERVQEFVRTFR